MLTQTPLKRRRARLAHTHQQVAAALRVSQQTVARWEDGDIPTKYLRDLALILSCRIDDLVGPQAKGRGSEGNEDASRVPYGTARSRLPRTAAGG